MSGSKASADGIFICYRREDSADVTGRIYDRLVDHFGPEPVFMDVDSITLGYDFRSEIDQKIKVCSIAIVVIGDEWLAEVDGKRRIDDENDHVRIEIEAALRRKIPIIPVLTRGASHPTKAMLPASLEDLAYRHGTSMRHEHFGADMDSLISQMDKLLGRQERTPAKPAGPKEPATPVKPTQTTQSRPAIPPVASISAIAASKEPAVWRRKRVIIVTAVAATVIVLLAITGLLTRPRLSVGRSAANDYAEAMKLATGLGGTRIDLPKAAEYLQRAAAKNVPEAEARLAYWINNGVGGLARDNVKAEQWAKKALADGLAAKAANSAEAQTELATLYEFGLGAPKDLEKAAELYQKAAHQGNQDAIANLKRLSKPAAAFPPGVGGVRINTSPPGATAALGGLGAKKTPVTFNANPGKYSLFIELDGYEPVAHEVEAREGELVDLGTITLQRSRTGVELTTIPQGAKVFQGDTLLGSTPLHLDNFPSGQTNFLFVLKGYLPREIKAQLNSRETFKTTVTLAKALQVYKGMISETVPITMKFGPLCASGIMTQSSTRGDTIVKFTGVWDGATLRALSREVVSKPEGILWEPESFAIRFSDDGKSAFYQCNYGTEMFVAKLSAP